MVDVIVRSMSHVEPARTVLGKIDTGADITIIPFTLVQELDLVPKYRLRMRGYDGNETERLGYDVGLEILGYKFDFFQVIAAPRDNVLLGRAVLNSFIITLDGKSQTFEMRDP